MEFVNDVISTMPDAFPLIPHTRISICLTNEFVGNQYSTFPSLAIYFYFDEQTVTIISVEENPLESYGL